MVLKVRGKSDLTEKFALDLMAFVVEASKLRPEIVQLPRRAMVRRTTRDGVAERASPIISAGSTPSTSVTSGETVQGELLREEILEHGRRHSAPTHKPTD